MSKKTSVLVDTDEEVKDVEITSTEVETENTASIEATEENLELETDKENVAENLAELNSSEVVIMAGKKRINVQKFLSLHPQNIYVTAYLKTFWKGKVLTEEEWFQVIEDYLNDIPN